MKEKSLLYPHTVPYIPLSPPQMPSLHLPVANMVRARMHAPSVFVCVSCTRRQQNTAPVRSDQRTMDDRGIMGEEEGKKTIMEVCSKGGVERSIRPTASRQKKKKKGGGRDVGDGVRACKVWTARHHDSLGVIMIEWSLIDCLSLQDLQSTSALQKRPLWKCLPPPHAELSLAPIPRQHDS